MKTLSKYDECLIAGHEVVPEPKPIDESLDYIPDDSIVDVPFMPGLHNFFKSKIAVLRDGEDISFHDPVTGLKLEGTALVAKIGEISRSFSTITLEVYQKHEEALTLHGRIELDGSKVDSRPQLLGFISDLSGLFEDHASALTPHPLVDEKGTTIGISSVAYQFK